MDSLEADCKCYRNGIYVVERTQYRTPLGRGPQREFYLPECWLRAGEKNVIILGLRQSETKGACLFGAEVAPYTEDVECME